MKRLFALQVLMLISALLFAGVVEAGPGIATVETDKGTVQGYISDGIYTFHGIPYAEVTKRFKPAEDVQPLYSEHKRHHCPEPGERSDLV